MSQQIGCIKPRSKVRILFFTSALSGGGAEMHLVRIINHLDRKQFHISLALVRSGGVYESAIASDVTVLPLNTRRTVQSLFPLRRTIRTEQPDVVCSIMHHANALALLASCALRIRPKVVVCVQAPPSIVYQGPWYTHRRGLLSLVPWLYPRADRVIALSKGVAEDLFTYSSTIQHRTEVIYNAGVDSRVLDGTREPLPAEELPRNGPLIVACGRLIEQKGFPYLIEALVRVRQYVPAHLWIIGEGTQRPFLEEKIRHLNLTSCVRLLGFQKNPYKYMAAADVFALSSVFEGFGNVIVEAMACGTPVVATDCQHGPAEIISHGVNGLLVPPADADALSSALLRVLTDQALQKELWRNGQERSQDFHAQIITSAYEDMFLRVVGRTKTRA